jgi:hypothetical protein
MGNGNLPLWVIPIWCNGTALGTLPSTGIISGAHRSHVFAATIFMKVKSVKSTARRPAPATPAPRSLKFAGRTPSSGGGWGGDKLKPGYTARFVAIRLGLAALALMLLVTLFSSRLGREVRDVPTLQTVWIAGPQLPNFRARGELQRVPVPPSQVLAAPVVFAGEVAQALDPQEIGTRGAMWLILLVWGGFVVWFVLAQLGEWKRPSLPLSLLLTLQVFGAAYYLSSFRAPLQRLETPFTAFDFHTHTTLSNGLLTPQQQIDWHRARGFKGLAFTDSDRLMPQSTLEALRAANPDMMLINGSEYHGRDAHLLFFGLKTPISSRTLDAPRAIREAKKQGALVIVAHPWHPQKYSAQQFIKFGVDGFEPWNGVIWDRNLAQGIKARGLSATSGTDTLSKSGAHCYTWTLIPRGMDEAGDVLRALKLRKTAVAFALDASATPQAFEARRDNSRSPAVVFGAVGQAWRNLARAQQINTLLGLVAAAAFLWAWGAEGVRKTQAPLGPNRALGFLRRKRLLGRLLGALLVLGAFAGSIWVAVLTMSGTYKHLPLVQQLGLTPLHALLAWIVLDALYFYGRALWQRTH